MTGPLSLTPLPEPQRTRWQPLRVGLIELYHYDCEEFWFRDGHLMLRGNNGTGKSKVLSLTLPFLLDLNLSPSRVEPDGERGKRMEWNLLMGGRYDRRTGYTWIEFGRNDESGPRYLTLGCGLYAVAGRAQVDTWPFITEQRIGEDLWLISRDRVVLSRERLAERLGGRGQIFDRANEYRRAVDERLFRLGEERYRALIDTLIQLRQPQLSRRPDEQTLSDALTEALPPLPQATLEDVAEAMTQLDDYRHELAELETLRASIAQFGRRYAQYARVRARREARVLRQGQTEFDNASRTLSEARAQLDGAEAQVTAHAGRLETLKLALARNRARLSELQRDPVMRDAARLRESEARAEEADERRAESERLRASGERTYEKEKAAAVHIGEEEKRLLSQLEGRAALLAEAASAVGLASDRERAEAKVSPYGALVERERRDIDSAALLLREATGRRREQIAQLRRVWRALEEAAAARDRAAEARSARAEDFNAAASRASAAEGALQEQAAAHLAAWRDFLDRLGAFDLARQDEAMDALATWVDALVGDHPAQRALVRARDAQIAELAAHESASRHERSLLGSRQSALHAERDALAAGGHPLPAAPYTRAADARAGRAGAPLWQLLEFAPAVDEAARAGLEAALEAAGLLDAWVSPEGTVIDPGTHDVLLVPRGRSPTPLRAWLRPAGGEATVAADRIERLLESIACGDEDPGEAEAWVSPQGRFRLGPARGAWMKPAAQYIGYAAREAARRARLAALDAELATVRAAIAEADERLQDIAGRRADIEAACARAPGDGILRDAHARCAATESARREAHERLAEADVRHHEAERVWQQVHGRLVRDAEDLRLPADPGSLADFERKLAECWDAARDWIEAAHEYRRVAHDATQQDARAQEARTQMEYWRDEHDVRRRAAEEASARRDALLDTVGAAVQELEQRLRETEHAVADGEDELETTSRRHTEAVSARGAATQKVEDGQQMLEERQRARQSAVDRLQGFARTGLLAVAIPELQTPDPAAGWTIDPALQLARRIEQVLAEVPADEADWTRIQSAISTDFNQLLVAMAAQGHQAQSEQTDYGMAVHVVYRNRPERPDLLERRLGDEIAERREILTAREREVLQNHLQAEVAASLQKLLQESERRVRTINAELDRRPTSTGVRFRLEWQALPEGEEGAPVGLAAARARLLQRAPDAWSTEDRRVIGEFLQHRIQLERSRDDGVGLLEHLTRALDYRRWHRFRIRRLQEGAWRPLSGPASSGERALGLTVPLFAAASSHYASADYPNAPRLVLLDEAYAGIDDEARAHCMALIREFDLDFVMTSEREWGCYAELPGLAICQLVRREGVDAVYVSRWSWDGAARREEVDPSRRFPESAAAS